MDIKEELAQIKEDLDQRLAVYLDDKITAMKKHDVVVAQMLRYFKKILLAGGKRIRPAMMYHGYLAAGGQDKDAIMNASMSIELIHAFLLMHDDIVDRDDLRHGKPTMHAHYRRFAQKYYDTDDPEHFGVSTGLIMGDLIYSLGNEVLFSSAFPPQRILLALQKMQEVVKRTALGEMQDIIMEYHGDATEDDIISMYKNKTARYTFEGPFELGALLAGASEEQVTAMSAFAVPLGVAFQLRDDYLGIYGSEEKTGKPVGSDIAEGKQTLFVARAFARAHSSQKKQLRALLGNEQLSSADRDAFCRILDETGAMASVMEDIQRSLDSAQKLIVEAHFVPAVEEFLLGLTHYLKQRES